MNLWVDLCTAVESQRAAGDHRLPARSWLPEQGMTNTRQWTAKPALTTVKHRWSTIHMRYYCPCKNFSSCRKGSV